MTDNTNLPSTETRQGSNLADASAMQNQLGDMFAGLLAAVRDPSVSPEKAAAMLDVQERLLDRQALQAFNAARAQAMMDMPTISREGKILNKKNEVQSRYARFEDIDRVVRPICALYGLVYSFNLGVGERGATLVTCQLAHVGGHVQDYGPLAVPLDTSGAKNPTQGVGSSSSYGKRYTLCAALNIVTEGEDNDGRTATRSRADFEPEWGEELIADAHTASSKGAAKYRAFFDGLSPMRKGWLMESGHHETFKNAAASIPD